MAWRALIPKSISTALGNCGLARQNIVRVLAIVHNDLPREADIYRGERLQGDGRLFSYRIAIFDGGRWHRIDLSVDDTTAPDILLIADLAHHIEPDDLLS